MSKTKRNNTRISITNTTNNIVNNTTPMNTTYNPNATNSMSQPINNNHTNGFNPQINQKTSTPSFSGNSLTNKFSTLKKNKKFDKTQIGAPTNFRIVQHVGLTNNDYEVNYCHHFLTYFKKN